MERNQFTFYRSYYEALVGLPEREQAKALLAIIRYALYEQEPEKLSAAGKVAFLLVKPTLDSGRKKASARADAAASGIPSGIKKDNHVTVNPAPSGIPGGRKEKEKEEEKEKEREKEKEKEGKSLVAPSGKMFCEIWDAYPEARRGSREEAEAAFRAAIRTADDAAIAEANLSKWKRSGQWAKDGGQYIPYLANWLIRGVWKTEPPTASGGDVKPSMELGEAEMEAIRRVMAEPLDWNGR